MVALVLHVLKFIQQALDGRFQIAR